MGDRSNIVIEKTYGESTRVYLYAHWAGQDIAKSALHGLKSGRATDSDYLARVIFENMIQNDLGSETGFGIGASLSDNEHEILVISNSTEGTVVYFEGQPTYGANFEQVTRKVPYGEFVAMVESIEDWEAMANSNTLYAVLINLMGI